MRNIRRSTKTIPPERVRELKRLAEQIDREEASAIKTKGRQVFARREALIHAVRLLKDERQRLGLSLTEVGERSGVGKANLSRLENDPSPNPTVETLMRYAEALGRTIRIEIAA